ncbi:MAG: DUF6455 family protein [Pseudomonadota bacterium]
MALLNRINDKLSLMGESMARSGALENPAGVNFERDYRRAVTSCVFCKHGKECKDFQAATQDAASGGHDVPSYCPNIATFERMKQG